MGHREYTVADTHFYDSPDINARGRFDSRYLINYSLLILSNYSLLKLRTRSKCLLSKLSIRFRLRTSCLCACADLRAGPFGTSNNPDASSRIGRTS